MPSYQSMQILSILPNRHSNIFKCLLWKKGLIIDSRVICWDDYNYNCNYSDSDNADDNPWRFECTITGRALTIQKRRRNDDNGDGSGDGCGTETKALEDEIIGWDSDIYFRIYDPEKEDDVMNRHMNRHMNKHMNMNIPSSSSTFFSADNDTYIYFGLEYEKPPLHVSKVIIHPSVKIIRPRAFNGCTNMTCCIMMGDNVTTISEEAFAGCVSLRKILFSRNITDIGPYSFLSCRSLDVVYLNFNVHVGTCIAAGAGAGAGAVIGGENDNDNDDEETTCSEESSGEYKNMKKRHVYIQREAFADCRNLRMVVLPPPPHDNDNAASNGGNTSTSTSTRTRTPCRNGVQVHFGEDVFQNCRALLTHHDVQYDGYPASYDSNIKVNQWLQYYYYYESLPPIYRQCLDPNVNVTTAGKIRSSTSSTSTNTSIVQNHKNTEQSVLGTRTRTRTRHHHPSFRPHGLNPLHILTLASIHARHGDVENSSSTCTTKKNHSRHAIMNAIIACYETNPSMLFERDSNELTPLDYLWESACSVDYDDDDDDDCLSTSSMDTGAATSGGVVVVDGIVHLIQDLCIHRLNPNRKKKKIIVDHQTSSLSSPMDYIIGSLQGHIRASMDTIRRTVLSGRIVQ